MDDHHKVQAAAEVQHPLQLLTFLSLDASLATAARPVDISTKECTRVPREPPGMARSYVLPFNASAVRVRLPPSG